MISATNIVSWMRWVDAAPDEVEKSLRTTRVRNHIFPEGLDATEKARRETIVSYLGTLDEPIEGDGWPAPSPPPDETPIPINKPTAKWAGLIPATNKAHKRASLHDGTGDEVDKMRSRAKGSPFDAED